MQRDVWFTSNVRQVRTVDVCSIWLCSRSDEVYNKHPRNNVNDMCVRRIFKDLREYFYWIQLEQRFTEPDTCSRFVYCGTFSDMAYDDPDFLKNVWFYDESHLHLDGNINQQTTRFLFFLTGQMLNIVQKPLHCTRVTIWCAFSLFYSR